MDPTALETYDDGLDVTTVRPSVSGLTYCIDHTTNGKSASVTRGAGVLASGKVTDTTTCPAVVAD
jgi:hypothetical protein